MDIEKVAYLTSKVIKSSFEDLSCKEWTHGPRPVEHGYLTYDEKLEFPQFVRESIIDGTPQKEVIRFLTDIKVQWESNTFISIESILDCWKKNFNDNGNLGQSKELFMASFCAQLPTNPNSKQVEWDYSDDKIYSLFVTWIFSSQVIYPDVVESLLKYENDEYLKSSYKQSALFDALHNRFLSPKTIVKILEFYEKKDVRFMVTNSFTENPIYDALQRGLEVKILQKIYAICEESESFQTETIDYLEVALLNRASLETIKFLLTKRVSPPSHFKFGIRHKKCTLLILALLMKLPVVVLEFLGNCTITHSGNCLTEDYACVLLVLSCEQKVDPLFIKSLIQMFPNVAQTIAKDVVFSYLKQYSFECSSPYAKPQQRIFEKYYASHEFNCHELKENLRKRMITFYANLDGLLKSPTLLDSKSNNNNNSSFSPFASSAGTNLLFKSTFPNLNQNVTNKNIRKFGFNVSSRSLTSTIPIEKNEITSNETVKEFEQKTECNKMNASSVTSGFLPSGGGGVSSDSTFTSKTQPQDSSVSIGLLHNINSTSNNSAFNGFAHSTTSNNSAFNGFAPNTTSNNSAFNGFAPNTASNNSAFNGLQHTSGRRSANSFRTKKRHNNTMATTTSSGISSSITTSRTTNTSTNIIGYYDYSDFKVVNQLMNDMYNDCDRECRKSFCERKYDELCCENDINRDDTNYEGETKTSDDGVFLDISSPTGGLDNKELLNDYTKLSNEDILQCSFEDLRDIYCHTRLFEDPKRCVDQNNETMEYKLRWYNEMKDLISELSNKIPYNEAKGLICGHVGQKRNNDKLWVFKVANSPLVPWSIAEVLLNIFKEHCQHDMEFKEMVFKNAVSALNGPVVRWFIDNQNSGMRLEMERGWLVNVTNGLGPSISQDIVYALLFLSVPYEELVFPAKKFSPPSPCTVFQNYCSNLELPLSRTAESVEWLTDILLSRLTPKDLILKYNEFTIPVIMAARQNEFGLRRDPSFSVLQRLVKGLSSEWLFFPNTFGHSAMSHYLMQGIHDTTAESILLSCPDDYLQVTNPLNPLRQVLKDLLKNIERPPSRDKSCGGTSHAIPFHQRNSWIQLSYLLLKLIQKNRLNGITQCVRMVKPLGIMIQLWKEYTITSDIPIYLYLFDKDNGPPPSSLTPTINNVLETIKWSDTSLSLNLSDGIMDDFKAHSHKNHDMSKHFSGKR